MSFCELDAAYNHFVLLFVPLLFLYSCLSTTLCLSISCFKRCLCNVHMRASSTRSGRLISFKKRFALQQNTT